MKKFLYVFIVALLAIAVAPSASAQGSKTFNASAISAMQFDDYGNELGWSEWKPCSTPITMKLHTVIIHADKVFFDEDLKLTCDEEPTISETNEGFIRMEWDAIDDTDEEVTLALETDPNNDKEAYLVLDTDEASIRFLLKESSLIGSKKSSGKKSSGKSRRRK